MASERDLEKELRILESRWEQLTGPRNAAIREIDVP